VIPILLYHQVIDLPTQRKQIGLPVQLSLFKQQMAYLYRIGFQCVCWDQFINQIQNRTRLPGKNFILTFDDGYRDFLDNAWPVLARYGFTATIFLVVKSIGSVSNWHGQSGNASLPLLSWEDIRTLQLNGMNFGSHTLTHPRLTGIDLDRAEKEITESKSILQDHLGDVIDLFSYPYGSSNPTIQKIVSSSGYKAACGVDRGRTNVFNLWRTQITGRDTMLTFILKIFGWQNRFIFLREQTFIGKFIRRLIHPGAISR
jgi:peptidoglycan/xylan/chitin deacetylase (PgdA/CDA1 family)